MGEPLPGVPPSIEASEKRLDSWKEIAAYLNRDVTTVQRWEKREGMPVHRHVHDKRGSVYALNPELDAWLQSRGLADYGRNLAQAPTAKTPSPPVATDGQAPRTSVFIPMSGN
jgi:hypothetical protein